MNAAGRLRGLFTFATRAMTSAVSILNVAECADRDYQGGKLTFFFQKRNGPTSWQFDLPSAASSIPGTPTSSSNPAPKRGPGRPRIIKPVPQDPSDNSQMDTTTCGSPTFPGPAVTPKDSGSALSALVNQYGESDSSASDSNEPGSEKILAPQLSPSTEKVSPKILSSSNEM